MTDKFWDLLIRGARVFDGSGEPPRVEDVAVRDGRIAARGVGLPTSGAAEVIDAEGKWLMPGLLDIHTHFDLEVEIAPGLPEAVRHGTTTVVVANCSLGLAFGNQRREGADPVVDCFARVENVPKHVLSKVADQADWHDSGAYLEHLDSLALGANIVTMIPHSMLRIEVMGLEQSISREPTGAELDEMAALLDKGMRQGYAGFSTDALPFHYLANDPHRDRKIPTQYGSYGELKRLTGVVRRHGRVWQATPPKDSVGQTLRNLLLTSGRLHGKPLKTTVVAALDVATNRGIAKLGMVLARLLNSRALDGRFALQALAGRFKVWSEGPINPIFEEIPVLRQLNMTDLEDRAARRALLEDPLFVRDFREMWQKGKTGFGLDAIKRRLKREDLAFSRSLEDMVVDGCPVPDWSGEAMSDIHERLRSWQAGDRSVARSEAESKAFDGFPDPIRDDADFFLHLLKVYDTDLYWYMITANRDAEMTRKLIMHPKLLPGFNDSGAHLTNMAFYDCNLRALQLASADGDEGVAYMVRRLTRDPAAFFGIPAGRIDPGSAADITLVDPEALADYDAEANIRSIYREDFEHSQLVNRSDGVVPWVIIGGRVVWQDGAYTPVFGQEKCGRVLRAA